MSERAAWAKRPEAGTSAGLRFVEFVAKVGGRRAAHAVVGPIAAWFLATRTAERIASRDFLSRVLGRPATTRDSFRHFHTFARVSVDRYFLQSGRAATVPMRIGGQEQLQRVLDARRGCIIVSAHFGSFEAARQTALLHPGMTLLTLLDRNQNMRLLKRLERVDARFAADILDAGAEPQALALRIGAALDAGDWIGWLADRYRPNERTATVEFLGRAARFPVSPYLVATLYRVPVFLVLAVYDDGGYRISVDPLLTEDDYTQGNRTTMVEMAVVRFAERLATEARRYPYNWFNFYDVWHD